MQQQKSRVIIIGSILAIVGSVIAVCPLSIDFLLGAHSLASGNSEFGQNLVNVGVFRIIFILLTIIFSVIFLVRNKSSRIFSSPLLLSTITTIVLPFVLKSSQVVGESIGGLFASVFLIIALIGGIVISIVSFRKGQ